MNSLAPDDWILREVSERDYGIDYYIELSNQAGEITGDLLSIQLKAQESIEWRVAAEIETARSPSISVATANYWLKLPVPVLLFVADLAQGDIYIANVKPTLRSDFAKLQTQDTVSFQLYKPVSLSSKIGKLMARAFYARERGYSRFETHLTALLSNMEFHSTFILSNQLRDCFLEVETSRHLECRALYSACASVANYTGLEWDVPKLIDVYREDRQEWKDEFCFFHERSLDRILSKLQLIYPKLLVEALRLVTESERDYWRAASPFFFALCSSGELRSQIRSIEERFAKAR